jgi:hypothetical protein
MPAEVGACFTSLAERSPYWRLLALFHPLNFKVGKSTKPAITMNHFAPLPGALTWRLSDGLVRLSKAMSVLLFLLHLLLGTTIAESATAWPSEGKVVYYRPATISGRCLVPEHLYNFDKDASLSCARFPPEQIFRFTEAIVGTKIELSFRGKIVTGSWYSAASNIENDDIAKILMDGKIFFRKALLGGKVDEVSIVGVRKGKLIQAKANSEGHAPDLGVESRAIVC